MYSKPDVGVFGIGKEDHPSVDEAIAAIKRENELTAKKVIPKFESSLEERNHRKQRLVAGLRLFAKYGYDAGVAGHITVRDPENPQNFWVNPFGRHFGSIKIQDLILINHHGEVIGGSGALNKAAFIIHGAIHNSRPEVMSVVHAHSMYGKVWSTTGRLLEPITQDSCAFYEDHAISEPFSGVVYGDSEGKSIQKA